MPACGYFAGGMSWAGRPPLASRVVRRRLALVEVLAGLGLARGNWVWAAGARLGSARGVPATSVKALIHRRSVRRCAGVASAARDCRSLVALHRALAQFRRFWSATG